MWERHRPPRRPPQTPRIRPSFTISRLPSAFERARTGSRSHEHIPQTHRRSPSGHAARARCAGGGGWCGGGALAHPHVETARLWYGVIGVDVSHHQGDIDWPVLAHTDVASPISKPPRAETSATGG